VGEGGGEVCGPVVVGRGGLVVEGSQPRGSGGDGELGQGLNASGEQVGELGDDRGGDVAGVDGLEGCEA